MNDIAQVQLADAPQTDWDNYSSTGKFQVPPPALDAKGDPIVYYGTASGLTEKANDYAIDEESGKHLLNFSLDPFVVSQGDHKGYALKFVEVNLKRFLKNGKPGNTHSLGNYLRAAGIQAKPQTNDEYRAAVRMAQPKQVAFTLDWRAKNQETGEEIKGFNAFPEDPDRPGQRKAILKQGDFYNIVDAKGKPTGQQAQVKSEVLFANARLRFFRDASRGK